MALASGVRLGVYEVRELIGAGGMGEVYRALDTNLNRDVALKILPDVFANDPDRAARFKREAQLLASLNHANIGSIFGFEESNGVRALVLELVQGPTLADRIAHGPLPLHDALPIARQIVEALEAAHAQGVVHRDLKPANIKVRPDGTVKVLDFGLAKMFDPPDAGSRSGSERPSLSPTLPTITSPAATQIGMILGTAAYMSPEQARGKPADKRSDVWAFGAVLYEMLTGRRAFDGDEVSDTLASILKSETNWSTLPADTPPAVRRVLQRCLQKDPKRRIHDIADARLDLDEPVTEAPVAVPARSRFLTRERIAWGILVATLSGVLAYRLMARPAPAQVVRFQVNPPENGFFGSASGVGRADGTSGGALSPDGTQLAFVATDQAQRTQLWLRRLDSFQSRPLVGTDDVLMPFWSPDSRSIGFFAGGKVKRIDLADGTIQTLCDVLTPPRGGTWGRREFIVFSSGTPQVFARVSTRGGAATTLPLPNPGARFPSFLPDGRHFLYSGRHSDSVFGLSVASIEPGFESKALVPSDSNGVFVAPGFLLFTRGETLMQQPFDVDRLEVTGEATPVVEQVFRNPGVGRADFSASDTGVLAFRSSSSLGNQFAWFDRAGKLIETVGPPGNYRTPDLSPDGRRLAYGDVSQGDIWILDLTRKTSSRFTANPGTQTAPVWFPDGAKIAYRSDQGGLFEKDVSGTGTEKLLLNQVVGGPMQISPDGQWVLYFAVSPGKTQDIFVLPTSGERTPRAIVQSPFPDVEPQLSPDGRWLAYASTETGRNEIYVQPFPPTGARWQVSSAGGRQPLWRADGKELFFVSDDRRFYAVDVSDKSGVFEYGVPQFLFEMRANVFNSRNSYIPSRDGQRFLVNMLLEADNSPINVVHNWTAGLGR